MNGTNPGSRRLVSALAGLALATGMLSACGGGSGDHAVAAPVNAQLATTTAPTQSVDKVTALYATMHNLWADHMQYTVRTVDAFFHNKKELPPLLDRLLANQKDIGDAVGSYFGQDAGAKVTELLTTHIKEAVPVLTAAKDGDKAALAKAGDDWYANAKQIADYLSAANPDNWPTSATEPALHMHIEQTTTYAVDLLKGNYGQAVKDYDAAFQHMMGVADILAKGIVAKFPDKFTS
jgi:hypothetical protein